MAKALLTHSLLWINLSPVENPWSRIVITPVIVLIPVGSKDFGLITIFLLKSSYFTITVFWTFGLTSINTLWSELNPWLVAVVTITLFCIESAVILGYCVVKLWYVLEPRSIKSTNPILLVVAAIPENTPVDPIPTLTVEIPTKSLSNLAI